MSLECTVRQCIGIICYMLEFFKSITAAPKKNMYTRSASHAGSWYDGRETVLKSQLEGWIEEASQNIEKVSCVKAVIVPHAGYRHVSV